MKPAVKNGSTHPSVGAAAIPQDRKCSGRTGFGGQETVSVTWDMLDLSTCFSEETTEMCRREGSVWMGTAVADPGCETNVQSGKVNKSPQGKSGW